MFISNFPKEGSFMDYYYDIEEAEWKKFKFQDEVDKTKTYFDR